MSLKSFFIFAVLSLAWPLWTFGQSSAENRDLSLDVAVTQSNIPVSDLQQQDFTVLDNNVPRSIKSFRAVSKGQQPIHVFFVVDAVNARYTTVAYARQQIQRYLKENGGHLENPATIMVLTDKGAQIQRGFSTDGTAMSDALSHYQIDMRQITHATGFWGANDRAQISLVALHQLVEYAKSIPGRKVVLWISPGWPLLSGAYISLTTQEQRQIFDEVVGLSTQLRSERIVLYNVNPVGLEESMMRADYYQGFLQGVSKPAETNLADLSLQVLSIQSGGRAIELTGDVEGALKGCVIDAESWYEISFETAPTEKPNEYRRLSVKLSKPGLIARTRNGYYAQP